MFAQGDSPDAPEQVLMKTLALRFACKDMKEFRES
jgi:hypothetical protein